MTTANGGENVSGAPKNRWNGPKSDIETVETGPQDAEIGSSGRENSATTAQEPAVLAELRSLLSRAKHGDDSVLPRLRAILDDHPEIWMYYGDLAQHAQNAWLELACGSDLGLAEAVRRKLQSLQSELAGPSPSQIELLLAQRAVAAFVQTQWADSVAAQAREVSIKQAELAVKRQNAAHRRYLTALGALATVQRLLPASKHAGARAEPISGPIGRSETALSPPEESAVDDNSEHESVVAVVPITPATTTESRSRRPRKATRTGLAVS
jgi:hypothetical protein